MISELYKMNAFVPELPNFTLGDLQLTPDQKLYMNLFQNRFSQIISRDELTQVVQATNYPDIAEKSIQAAMKHLRIRLQSTNQLPNYAIYTWWGFGSYALYHIRELGDILYILDGRLTDEPPKIPIEQALSATEVQRDENTFLLRPFFTRNDAIILNTLDSCADEIVSKEHIYRNLYPLSSENYALNSDDKNLLGVQVFYLKQRLVKFCSRTDLSIEIETKKGHGLMLKATSGYESSNL